MLSCQNLVIRQRLGKSLMAEHGSVYDSAGERVEFMRQSGTGKQRWGASRPDGETTAGDAFCWTVARYPYIESIVGTACPSILNGDVCHGGLPETLCVHGSPDPETMRRLHVASG